MTGGRVRLDARISPTTYIPPNHQARTECAGDDCPCRRGDPVHPPLVMRFYPELGEYDHGGPMRCTAVWAASGPGRDRGRICDERATHMVADIYVCEHHYRRIREWMNTRDQRDLLAAKENARRLHEYERRLASELGVARLEMDQRRARQQIELDRERIRAEEAARKESSLIYYIRRESDGLIKIGTSRNLARRLGTHKREHGPLQLMAVEGGGQKQESALHRQFTELRAEGREWFRPGLPLLEHIYRIMRERPVEAAPGLPPIMGSRTVGGMIHGLRCERAKERRLLREEEEKRLKRHHRQVERDLAALAAPPAA